MHAENIESLGSADVALFESFVAPRYLHLFLDLVLAQLAAVDDAQLAHVYCRTGYGDGEITARLHGVHIYGCDPSENAISLATAKSRATPGMVAKYRTMNRARAPFPDAAFSHALSMHSRPGERSGVLAELVRLVAVRGQVLFALPLRESFAEIFDLLREYALKFERDDFASVVDRAADAMPTRESLAREASKAGLTFVDVRAQKSLLRFDGGKGFFEDSIARLLIVPEIEAQLSGFDLGEPLAYVRDAIDKYWSESLFSLTVVAACVSGRKL